MWAFKRRLNIILLIVGFIVCFGVIPYVVTHIEKPTCFDLKQNQQEEGVDCGGPCALVCKGKADPLKVIWKKVAEVRPGTFEAAFFVENTNFNVGAPKVPYEVKVFSDTGTLLATRNGMSYAGPNENMLIYEGNINTGNAVAANAEITFGDFQWVATGKREAKFTILNKTLQGVDGKPRLTADVRNDSLYPEQHIEVAAVISDDNGGVIGFGKTVVDRLEPGASQPIAITWTYPFSYQASIASCDKPVDVMLAFDRSGSMASDSENPPEPLTTAKNAASAFTSRLRSSDQAGLVSFATAVSKPIDRLLTDNKDKVKESVLGIAIGKNGKQYTDIGDALKASLAELQSLRKNPSALQSIILLTDGIPTYPIHPEDKLYPITYAKKSADAIREAGVSLYTIGLGKDVDGGFLKDIATKPENFYQAETSGDLADIYTKISSVLCKKAPSVIELFPRVNNVGN